MRLHYNGDFSFCRWTKDGDFNFIKNPDNYNIKNISLLDYYNSPEVNNVRTNLLQGNTIPNCQACLYEEKFGKNSGRLKQLLKSGINVNDFDNSMRSSPHYELFAYSYNNQGKSNYYPVDLQIDLGNVCNSACIMCDPVASSRLSSDYEKLTKIDSELFRQPLKYQSWTSNEIILNKFINELESLPQIKYIHFLGGETLYDEAFYKITDRLIKSGLAKNMIVGTTTNGTIYDKRIESIIGEFKQFHLGISIESMTKLNDYIRWPSNITQIKNNIVKFSTLRKKYSELFVSLRITPNIFTINELDQLIEFQIEHSLIAESCNIMHEPDCLIMELLPDDIRKESLDKLESIIKKYDFNKFTHLNTRRPDLIHEVIGDTAIMYRDFLQNFKNPENVDKLRFKLVKFLKSFETIRQNSIIDYAPRYEKFLRSYGY